MRRVASTAQRRWSVYRADPQVIAIARHTSSIWAERLVALRPDGNPRHRSRTHVGTYLSGAKVVADTEFTAQLTSVWTNALGLEMEATGVAAAVHAAGADGPMPRF